MKALFAIWTIAALLGKDIASFSWDVWFYLNQQEIAREKCENKARPTMHCDGKCYLAKQLRKLEQKEQDHSSKSNPFRNVEKGTLFLPEMRFAIVPEAPADLNQSFYTYQSPVSQENTGEIFHPPAFV